VNYPEFGSVCSGGRYDNLASEYTEKKLPGVGISIGLSRLFDQLLKNRVIETDEATYSKIFILPMTENEKDFALDLVSKIRAEKIPAEIDLNFERKIAKRAKYAEKLNIPFVLFIGEEEKEKNIFSLKNFQTSKKIENLSLEKIINILTQ
jgi:histidyl-tRNA synthetase